MKIKRVIFFISLAVLLFFVSAKKKSMASKYYGHCHKDESFFLEINKDSSFIQRYETIGSSYITQGIAFIKNDTLSLNIKTIFRLSNKKKIEVIDTTDNIYELAHSFSNYLVKRDTIVILFQRTENRTDEWCRLAKIEK